MPQLRVVTSGGTSAGPEQDRRAERRKTPWGRRKTDRPRIEDYHDGVIELGPFRLDQRQKSCYIEGRRQNLSPKLFDLLTVFVINHERLMSAKEIAMQLWPSHGRAGAVEVKEVKEVKQYIYLLRKAIEADPVRPRWLCNVRGFGYTLIVDEMED